MRLRYDKSPKNLMPVINFGILLTLQKAILTITIPDRNFYTGHLWSDVPTQIGGF
jgi:hypothetical protein